MSKLKEESGAFFAPDFNLLHFLEKNISRIWGFSIQYYEDESGERHAYVSIKRKVLFISNEIAERARLNEEFARFVLAHEIGHIHLHSDDIHFFSNQSHLSSRWAQEEEQTEWQADRFAEFFLVSDEIVRQYSSATELAEFCSIPMDVASRRWEFNSASVRRSEVVCRCGRLVFASIGENEVCPDCPEIR